MPRRISDDTNNVESAPISTNATFNHIQPHNASMLEDGRKMQEESPDHQKLHRVHDLPRVHEPVWVQSALDALHHVDSGQPQLLLK
jgi:hypothetical protein